jgi:CubicO group peptidase (beta-lactamase class C family)
MQLPSLLLAAAALAPCAAAFSPVPPGSRGGLKMRFSLGFSVWGGAGKGEDGGGGGSGVGGGDVVFGHGGVGGSLAFFCARSRLGVAITLSQLSEDRRATRAVLALLARELGVNTRFAEAF